MAWWIFGLLRRMTSKAKVSWWGEEEVSRGREVVGRWWKVMEEVVAETWLM